MDVTPERIPRGALLLTLAGLIPFDVAAIGVALSLDDPARKAQAALTLLVYAATIISFLGGIRWGAEISSADDRAPNTRLLTVSVLGTLCAWALVLYAVLHSVDKTVFAAFAILLIIQGLWDMRPSPSLPVWYPKLRFIATAGAVFALAFVAFIY